MVDCRLEQQKASAADNYHDNDTCPQVNNSQAIAARVLHNTEMISALLLLII